MNRNYNRNSNNGKQPGFMIGIIFALLGLIVVVPQLIPIVVFVAIFLIKNNQKVKNTKASSYIKEKIKTIEANDIVVSDKHELNLEDYKNKTETQKRLESLKSLYDNGFMDKDEYEDKRKRIK